MKGTAIISVAVGAILVLALGAVWTSVPVAAQSGDPLPTPTAETITYVVQLGDTLTRIANRYGVTVDQLVTWNGIENPDLIEVGQVLTITVPPGWAPTAPTQVAEGPLAFSWSVIGWEPSDPNYAATVRSEPRGGQPPYTYYHDGIIQPGSTFTITWRRCRPKPGSVGVSDATGTYVKEDYWLLAPYCPTGVEVLEPAEGAHLKHMPRHFNVTWQGTVDPAPALYGLEIEVWQDGGWQPWQTYEGFGGTLFFVPDVFPGDLGGRLRMWGIYEGKYPGPKTPWRYFEFRVTY